MTSHPRAGRRRRGVPHHRSLPRTGARATIVASEQSPGVVQWAAATMTALGLIVCAVAVTTPRRLPDSRRSGGHDDRGETEAGSTAQLERQAQSPPAE